MDVTRTSDTESLILSAPTAADAAAATGIPVRTAQHQRAAAGISTPTGRPKSLTSTRSLQALGSRAASLAALASVTPDELITAGWEAVTTEEQRAELLDDHAELRGLADRGVGTYSEIAHRDDDSGPAKR